LVIIVVRTGVSSVRDITFMALCCLTWSLRIVAVVLAGEERHSGHLEEKDCGVE
jgi:hypothetical protein